jgi:XisI protein
MKAVLEAIQTVLEDIAQPGKPSDVAYQIVKDNENHHYQVIVSGWRGMKRVHGIIVQIDVRGDLVWIEADNTDYDVAEALIKLGVPRDKIVLGFQPPSLRKHTGFATGEIAISNPRDV